jgi:hypothetical protein
MELINTKQEKEPSEVKHLPCLRLHTIDQNTKFCFVTTKPAIHFLTQKLSLNTYIGYSHNYNENQINLNGNGVINT